MKAFMKKTIAALLLIFILGGMLCACSKVDPVGEATVVLTADGESYEEYTVPLSKVNGELGALGLFVYLKEEEGLEYEADETAYGAYLTKVGSIANDSSKGKYVYVWTSVEEDFDTSAYALTVEYKGQTLTSSGLGISGMSVHDGAIIYVSYYPET